jgi:hypothetical protein
VTVKLLGYDCDGDRVYQDDESGKVVQADAIKRARELLNYPDDCPSLEAYAAIFGPITKRKP